MSGPDVLVLRRGVHGISTEAYAETLRERLPDHDVRRAATPHEERGLIGDATVVTGHRFTEEQLERATELELFACGSAGVAHLPLDEMVERGVVVTNAAGVHGPNIGEYVVGAILAFTRDFPGFWRKQQRREWNPHQVFELKGSTVTVVGLGAIGRAVVERLQGFDVRTIGVRYTPEKGGPTDEVIGFDGAAFHDALARTDYLVLACPLTDTTEGLIDAAAFETLPPEAVLVNIARGAIVDTDALLDAVQNNAVRGATLDVTDPEPLPADHDLWRQSDVFITPHNAGYTPRYYDRLADILVPNLERVEETGGYDDVENRVA